MSSSVTYKMKQFNKTPQHGRKEGLAFPKCLSRLSTYLCTISSAFNSFSLAVTPQMKNKEA